MKITNEDICKQLKEMDGESWKFAYGQFILLVPCFYVEGKSVNDMCHEYNTQMPISVFAIKDHHLTDEAITETFDNIDWAEVYKNLQPFKVEWALNNKEYICKNENFGFHAIIPTGVEKAIEKLMTKTKVPDEGRGGK